MKTVYISCPMKGRTQENIEKTFNKLYDIAKAIWGQDLKIANPLTTPKKLPETQKEKITALSKQIAKMASADYFITVSETWRFGGCEVEYSVAHAYDIPSFTMDADMMMDDYEYLWETRDIEKTCSE